MKRRILALLIGAVFTVSLVTACAGTGTKLVALWKDDAFQGRPAKILVIGASDDRGPRTLVEEEFVRQFKAHGIDAVASNTVFPAGPHPSKEEVLAKTRELGADAIMLIRFLKKEAGDTHTPVRRYSVPMGFDTSWDSYMGMGTMGTTTNVGIRDVSYDYNVISMDLTMFQTATGKPIWSGLSQTTYQEGPIKQIKPFTTEVMKELANEKLIR
jgi:hypothetical protein